MMMMKLMMEAVMDVAIWGVTYSLNGSNSLVFIRSFRSFTEKIMNIDRRYTITPTTDAMINRTYNKSIRQTDILKRAKNKRINSSSTALRHWRAARRHCYSPRVESKAQVVLGFNRHLFGHESVVFYTCISFMSQQCRQNYERKYINLN